MNAFRPFTGVWMKSASRRSQRRRRIASVLSNWACQADITGCALQLSLLKHPCATVSFVMNFPRVCFLGHSRDPGNEQPATRQFRPGGLAVHATSNHQTIDKSSKILDKHCKPLSDGGIDARKQVPCSLCFCAADVVCNCKV